MADTEERGFLRSIKDNPKDVTTRLAYADWLEDHDRPYEAFQQRVKAGVSDARYKIRRKSDGLFSDGDWGEPTWSVKGREWKRLGDVKGYLTGFGSADYGDTPWSDVEVVVFEVRMQPVQAMPISLKEARWGRRKPTVEEPK